MLDFREMRTYEEVLERIRPETSLGYSTIRVFQARELPPLQVGYSVNTNGDSLIGDGVGDWLKNWIVIGHEDLCGDPIFIDSSNEVFSVYTARHGEGRWDAELIATSLDGFGRILTVVAELATGRDTPVALQTNPISESQKTTALDSIERENGGMNLEFWEVLLG